MTESTGGRRPTLTIEPSIRVELSTKREGDPSHKMIMDDGTISAFLHWQADNEIFPFRGGVSSGAFYVADFPAEHADAINTYFKEQGLLIEGA